MTPAQVNDRQGELVDAVVAGFAEVAAAQARCAERVEALRRWSRDAAEEAARRRGLEHASGLDHGLAERSVTAELACALRLPERSASTLLVESQSLVHEHPATMTALRSGEVSYRHALAVLDATIGLDETSVLELDAILADKARTTTVSRLKRVARREREHRDPRPMTARHRLAAQDRHVELQPCEDGMAWLHHLLPAVQATAIFHRLTDIAAAVQGQDEPRTLAQLRADASIDLLLDDDARAVLAASTAEVELPAPHATLGGPSGTEAPGTSGLTDRRSLRLSTTRARSTSGPVNEGTGAAVPTTTTGDGRPMHSIAGVADRVSLGDIKPQVAVTIPVMTLLGHSDEPGDLAGHGPIDADTARRLAAQAPSFLRILTHPETGTVLSVGRDRYAVPADLRSWLRLRDETCRFPGCSRRAQRCDIDHVKDWAHGGATDQDNLIHLCRKHHRLKHTTGWTVSTESPGSAGRGDECARPQPEHSPALAMDRRASGSQDRSNAESGTSPEVGSDSARHAASRTSADVVYWTTPSGRTYLDRAAVEISRDHDQRRDEPGTATTDHGPAPCADEPPF
ncbi:DUF222 domain-containing protein [Sanguibacter sp. 4.1]|uniref:DUF222 domain-containing protein n=1 Tax=Sanguibacter biliveldensis TaxID=3030830 RepID=A0AAF0Z4Q4_9MICO|nr:DUF222 domain-containing protein [Sanguibacter sp. 4.1]WPF81097.1 DUF222 domain-containing protein [Sanguibacter sp. 4.1]